jgi:hypothetical protein
MRDPYASRSAEVQERDPYAGHVERELQGYLAAVDEGLPVLEPRSPLVAAVVIGQVARWLLHSVVESEKVQWARGVVAHASNRARRLDEPRGDLETRRRRLGFARYLFLSGRIHG